MRIRVDLQLDEPLRHGGKIARMEGEKFWVNFEYERLPTFCFICGRMGHDNRHCSMSLEEHNTSQQYGDWMRANGNPKMGPDRSHSTSSEGREDKNGDRAVENVQAMTRTAFVSVTDLGVGSSGNGSNQRSTKTESTGKVDASGSSKSKSAQI